MEQRGFSLVELMIALVISGLLMAAVVTVYTAQSKSYTIQDDIAGIQQNLRGALAVLTLEIRTAGCDPTEEAKAGIKIATSTEFQFTRDIGCERYNTCEDNFKPYEANGEIDSSGVEEIITYALNGDSDDNGIVGAAGADWSGTSSIGRETNTYTLPTSLEPLADNIEALEFSYLLKDDDTPVLNPSSTQLSDIRAVRVSLLARGATPAQDYTHTGSYTTGSGATWTPPNDHYRRRMVIATIQCRNMGL